MLLESDLEMREWKVDDQGPNKTAATAITVPTPRKWNPRNKMVALTVAMAVALALALAIAAAATRGFSASSSSSSFAANGTNPSVRPAEEYLWPAVRKIEDAHKQVPVSAFQIISNAPEGTTTAAFAALQRSLDSKLNKATTNTSFVYKITLSVAQPEAVTGPEHLDGADESYSLTLLASGATIHANTTAGTRYALQTLSQLITSSGSLLLVNITDSPRFPYRGLLLDTARNYFPPQDILRVLDGLYMSKMNVFHWHIYDSQSFPLQWDLYPQLSELGAYRYRNGTKKVYTKADVQHIVQYAFERNIRVIPEFDLPGHSAVFGFISSDLVSHWNSTPWESFCVQPPCGQLDPRNKAAIKVVEDLITDIGSWFKDPYIHVGHDELPHNAYDDETAARAKSNRTQIMRDFETQLLPILQKNGKKYTAWDEVIADYGIGDLIPRTSPITIWRFPSIPRILQAASSNFTNLVLGPADAWYLDCSPSAPWCQMPGERASPPTRYDLPGFVTAPGRWHSWAVMYAWDPLVGLDAPARAAVRGGFGALWSETVKRHNLDRYVFPRVSAIGERLWSYDVVPEDGNVEAVGRRLTRFRAALVNEARIGAAELGYLGNEEGMVYRPEACDSVSKSVAEWSQGKTVGGLVGNRIDGGDYCAIIALYDTDSLVYVNPERVNYGY
ncbi:glycoside hydrolase superfamily [Chytriomyces sp. MP71]|nr:glycoside hydrolase superfamily [Chytriomyces sp. MP71]